MGKPLIQLEGIAKSIALPRGDTLAILNRIDLSIPPQSVVLITGRSGSGKSTLLHILGLLDSPSAGIYRLDGADIRRFHTDDTALVRRNRFGFVFQQFHLLEHLSAWENIVAPLEYAERTERELAVTRASQLVSQLGVEHCLRGLPAVLSAGEQQRVALARALVRSPSVLFADEPTGSLDDKTAGEAATLLMRLYETENLTLVIVSHDRTLFGPLSTHHFELVNGTLIG